jgi:hypothetical protein
LINIRNSSYDTFLFRSAARPDLQRAHPRLTYESAYARIYAAPENTSLRDSVRKEHLAASMARAG